MHYILTDMVELETQDTGTCPHSCEKGDTFSEKNMELHLAFPFLSCIPLGVEFGVIGGLITPALSLTLSLCSSG